MVERDRTAGKIPGDSPRDDRRAKVEYSLTDWGQALCPALDAPLKWVDLKSERETTSA